MSIKEPSLLTLKRLFALSRNRCAFPDCSVPIVEDSGTVTGLICHIKARNKGGPRYDPKQTSEQRHAFENLILLCSRHSKIIASDPNAFSVEFLHNMKHSHERNGLAELSPGDTERVARLLADYREIYIRAGAHVMLNSPGAIQATSVVFRSQKSIVKILPTEEAVGLTYRSEITSSTLSMLGGMNRGKGISNYSSYEKFLTKYHHSDNP